MTKKISASSQSSNNPESGATDSPWQPSWWRWLLSALSGTVEIEKQHAKRQKQHEQRMKELREDREKYSAIAQQTRKETEQLKKENERLAVLESKIEELFYKYGINSNPTKPTDKP
jgi:hypothetical protein